MVTVKLLPCITTVICQVSVMAVVWPHRLVKVVVSVAMVVVGVLVAAPLKYWRATVPPGQVDLGVMAIW